MLQEKRKHSFLSPQVVKKKCVEGPEIKNGVGDRKYALTDQSTFRTEAHINGSCVLHNNVKKRDLPTDKSSGPVSLRFAIFHCAKTTRAQTLDLPLQKSKDGLMCTIGQNSFPIADAVRSLIAFIQTRFLCSLCLKKMHPSEVCLQRSLHGSLPS